MDIYPGDFVRGNFSGGVCKGAIVRGDFVPGDYVLLPAHALILIPFPPPSVIAYFMDDP